MAQRSSTNIAIGSPLTLWWTRFSDLEFNPSTRHLSEDELFRYECLRGEAQHYFSQSRLLMKSVIASYLNIPFSEIEFVLNRYGKPSLKHNPHLIEFNISHSKDYWAMIISEHHAVGIDLEFVDERLDYRAIMHTFFTETEIELGISNSAIVGKTQDQARADFFRIWVAKEAFTKAQGLGLSAFNQALPLVEYLAHGYATSDLKGVPYIIQSIDLLPELKLAVCVFHTKQIQIQLRAVNQQIPIL